MQSDLSKSKTYNFSVYVVITQSIKSKKEALWADIEELKPDIIAVSESWLNPNIHSSGVIPCCYDVYRKDRKHGYGGVLTAVRNHK